MALRCESRTGFLRPCGDNAVAVCQFCERPFCGRHGSKYAGGLVACFRGRCQMKNTVTTAVFRARGIAAARNADALCGDEACLARSPADACALCGGRYCVVHLNSRTFRISDTAPDGAARTRRERRYVCDSCVGAIDTYGLITLPPIPSGIPVDFRTHRPPRVVEIAEPAAAALPAPAPKRRTSAKPPASESASPEAVPSEVPPATPALARSAPRREASSSSAPREVPRVDQLDATA